MEPSALFHFLNQVLHKPLYLPFASLSKQARKPSWPFADSCSGNFLHSRNAV